METIVAVAVGAFIGWVTNWLAIQMLFHPRLPHRIGSFSLQGLVPARKSALAESVARVVASRLVNLDCLRRRLQDDKVKAKVHREIVKSVDRAIKDAVEELPMFIRESIPTAWFNKAKRYAVKKISDRVEAFPEHVDAAEFDALIRTLVVQSFMALDLCELEASLKSVVSRELKFIEIMGGVLGGFIGLAQALIL